MPEIFSKKANIDNLEPVSGRTDASDTNGAPDNGRPAVASKVVDTDEPTSSKE